MQNFVVALFIVAIGCSSPIQSLVIFGLLVSLNCLPIEAKKAPIYSYLFPIIGWVITLVFYHYNPSYFRLVFLVIFQIPGVILALHEFLHHEHQLTRLFGVFGFSFFGFLQPEIHQPHHDMAVDYPKENENFWYYAFGYYKIMANNIKSQANDEFPFFVTKVLVLIGGVSFGIATLGWFATVLLISTLHISNVIGNYIAHYGLEKDEAWSANNGGFNGFMFLGMVNHAFHHMHLSLSSWECTSTTKSKYMIFDPYFLVGLTVMIPWVFNRLMKRQMRLSLERWEQQS